MVTGCTCHDPAVFGHRELCETGTWFRDPARYRPRGEEADRALDRRLMELRAGLTRIPGIPYCHMHDLFNCPYAHGYQ